MSKMGKKVLPTLLAASMVCGSISPAYAADLFSAGEAVEFASENMDAAKNATDEVTLNVEYWMGTSKVEGKDTTITCYEYELDNLENIKDYIPLLNGYEIDRFDYVATDNKICVYVTPIQVVPSTTTIKIDFWTDDGTATGHHLGFGEVTASADDVRVDYTSEELKAQVPAGYVLCKDGGDELVGSDDLVNGYFRVEVRPNTTTIKIDFWTDNGTVTGKHLGYGEVTVSADDVRVDYTSEELKAQVPAGYVLCKDGGDELVLPEDLEAGNGCFRVEVRPATKVVTVIFQDRHYNPIKGSSYEMTVAADARFVNASTITNIPEGYEIAVTGKLKIKDGKVYVTLDKAKTKKITIIYKVTGENRSIRETQEVPANAKTVKVTAPEGYKLVDDEVQPIGKNNTVTVWVKRATKKVTVVYRTSDKKKVDSEVVEVPADANKVKFSDLTAPTGFTIISTKDVTIKGSTAYVTVKRTTKKVNVIFKTKDGKIVETRPMKVNATTTYLNAKDLKAKDGFTIISIGKVYFDKNGNAVVWVERTKKDIKVVFRTKAGRIIESRDMKVSLTTKCIKLSSLKAPKGYYIVNNKSTASINANGTAYVTVERDRK